MANIGLLFMLITLRSRCASPTEVTLIKRSLDNTKMALACPPSDSKCKLKCSAQVAVDLNPKPRAFCHRSKGNGFEFPVELEIKVNPHCEITKVKSYKHGCGAKIVLLVSGDFDCDAEVITGHCSNSRNIVDIDIEVPVDPKVKVLHTSQHKKKDQKEHSKQSKSEKKSLHTPA